MSECGGKRQEETSSLLFHQSLVLEEKKLDWHVSALFGAAGTACQHSELASHFLDSHIENVPQKATDKCSDIVLHLPAHWPQDCPLHKSLNSAQVTLWLSLLWLCGSYQLLFQLFGLVRLVNIGTTQSGHPAKSLSYPGPQLSRYVEVFGSSPDYPH